jgi:hypothetical protein
MFKTTKFIVALGLVATPMFGCVVDEDPDETSGTDSATTGMTMSTTASTTSDSTTTDSASTTTDSTTTTTTDSGTDSSTSDGTDSGTDTDTGGAIDGICLPECADPDECCVAYNLTGMQLNDCNAADGAEFGYWACDAGFCDPVLCTDNQECEDASLGDTCDDGTCRTACVDADADCPGGTAAGASCVDDFCAYEVDPCTSDADCGDFLCDTDEGLCIECVADDDCETSVFGGLCDTEIGFCGCTELTDCFKGDTCVE